MRIGIDFDNTIADYDAVFREAAVGTGQLDAGFEGGKTAVRDAIRNGPGGEDDWQRLQGQVYGRFMPLARPMPGVAEFLGACLERKADVYVISHKTEFGHYDEARINLRQAAMKWMRENGLFDRRRSALAAANVTFAATRQEKIGRIGEANVEHFIDDLPEVFADPGFPTATAQHLLGPGGYGHWNEIREVIFSA